MTLLSKRIWSAVLIGILFMAIAPPDLINKVCIGAIAGSAYYLLMFIWDLKE